MEIHGKRTVRFIASQLGASGLVLAVLFAIPTTALLEDQAREGKAAQAIATATEALQEMSPLTQSIVHGGNVEDQIARVRFLSRILRASEPRIADGLSAPMARRLEGDFDRYTATASRLRGDGSDAPEFHGLVDVQSDLLQQLASSERVHLDRTQTQTRWVYATIAAALGALLLLLVSGWRSLLRVSNEGERLREQMAEGDEGDRQLARMEELYLIVASSGVDPARQVERGLAYARTTLDYEWAIAIEWLDDEEAAVTSIGAEASPPVVTQSADEFLLEKAIARQASLAGEPVTFRVDRLPPALVPFGTSPRAFPWRNCLAYTFPGDYNERTPHCALFLATRKPRPEGVPAADQQLIRLIGTLVSSASRSARHHKRLDTLAFNDPLTGMPNRELLRNQLEEAIASAGATGGKFALHYIDLDGFKRVNDADGHEVGDEVLKIAALRMGKVLRAGETLARIGGDEFVVLQNGAESQQDAREVAERLIEQLSRPFAIHGNKHRIGASIGIAMYPAHGRSSSELLRHADSALYQSKRSGKGRASFYMAPVTSISKEGDVVA